MRIFHEQDKVKCVNVVIEDAAIIHLTGASRNALVERGARVHGGSLNDCVVSGKVILIGCEVRNCTVTGEGTAINEVISEDIRLAKTPKPKAKKYKRQELFDLRSFSNDTTY